jgi:hypothetical protein
MYGRSFEDVDGHVWETIFMDMSQMPKGLDQTPFLTFFVDIWFSYSRQETKGVTHMRVMVIVKAS